jgi:hypothetical protein
VLIDEGAAAVAIGVIIRVGRWMAEGTVGITSGFDRTAKEDWTADGQCASEIGAAKAVHGVMADCDLFGSVVWHFLPPFARLLV